MVSADAAVAVVPSPAWCDDAPKLSTGARRTFFGATILLIAVLVASVWLCREGLAGLHELKDRYTQPAAKRVKSRPEATIGSVVRAADAWAQQTALGAVAGCAGTMVLVLIGMGWARHRLWRQIRRSKHETSECERQIDELRAAAELSQIERQRLEADSQRFTAEIDQRVEQRTATLAAAHAELERELNSRRSAERQLAQQTKELERSKDVLEMHVQARTQEIQKLQQRNESILNSAGEGIYGVDLQGKLTFVNPAAARITGWKVEELTGKLEHEIFHRTGTALVAKDGVESLPDQVFHRCDGTTFPVEYMRSPIKEKDKLTGAVVIFKDITERKRADEALTRKAAELARSNAELEQFAYVASHDLQEPLRKIQAFGDRLKTKCDAVNLADGRDYLERMQNAAARMQTLINDLLTFSRVISASQPFVPVDLGTVVKGVLSDLEVRIEQTKAQVEVGPLPTIQADALQMRQLLQNLVGNALKFQPQNQPALIKISGQIRTRECVAGASGEVEEFCELTVQDNGIGFDEKYLDKIFAVFQRLHGRGEYEGTGVGLAVCRRITDRHGGTITARSKPGEGATFIIHLPVSHPPADVAAAA